jgi:hypothetical protein
MHVIMLLMPGPWTACQLAVLQYSTLSRILDAAAAQQLLTHQMTSV